MPARVIQHVEPVPVNEWRPFCLECCWVGEQVGDEADCARAAYEHNQAHHDGAGIDARLADFYLPSVADPNFYRKLFRRAMATAAVSLLVAIYCLIVIDTVILRAFAVGLNMGAGGANVFLAGKWAARIEGLPSAVDLPPGEA